MADQDQGQAQAQAQAQAQDRRKKGVFWELGLAPLAPENLELLMYLHENIRKVKMTYDSDLLKAPAKDPAQPEAQ